MDGCERRWASRADLDALCGPRLGGVLLEGLWVAGTLDGLYAPCVAVVGTRVPSDDGRRRARRLAEDLGRAGLCIVSGLALGIDGAAHEGALAAGAPTIGVLGGGHAHFFPPRNRELGARIVASGGAVVSPFAPDVAPQPWQFLARNAVIAALADAVVVVEAAARSGALNTAGHGAERGIPVLAFPGDVDRPKAAGCNALIRDGAILVRDADDVLAALPSSVAAAARAGRRSRRGGLTTRRGGDAAADGDDVGAQAGAPEGSARDSPVTREILGALRERACDASRLADRLGIAPPALSTALSELELGGRIVLGDDGYALAAPSARD
ncbi:MAG TPA: DNA-processing protein DprA [Candidatus Baltobacteraceae bacterium]|nr:DNA-processing protein DprA [Candidatus Baltobacteraceae bacterium]